MNIAARVKGILLEPKNEWPAIEREPGNIRYLFTRYVAIMAAIAPVCWFIRVTTIGYGPVRESFVIGLINAVTSYVLALISVVVFAYIINFLAGFFGGTKSIANAMKVASYALTAIWVAGVFGLIPYLSFLAMLAGFYSLYLLHTGLAALMKPTPERAVIYTFVVVGCVMAIEALMFAPGLLWLSGTPAL